MLIQHNNSTGPVYRIPDIAIDDETIVITTGDKGCSLTLDSTDISKMKDTVELYYGLRDVITYMEDEDKYGDAAFDDNELLTNIAQKYRSILNDDICGETAPMTWRCAVREAMRCFESDLEKYII